MSNSTHTGNIQAQHLQEGDILFLNDTLMTVDSVSLFHISEVLVKCGNEEFAFEDKEQVTVYRATSANM